MSGLLRKNSKANRTLRAAQGVQEDTPPADAEVPAEPSGSPRIVINPTTFHNKKDALCVAFNEGFRIWMEVNDFQPQSEPTDAQRKFFSDTAYADDELQLRRTILARIATFDTSVKDPTDDQLAETGSFLDAILESDWCKNEWERNCVSRLAEAVKASVGAEPVEPRPEPVDPREPEPLQSRAALGGGETEDEDEDEDKDKFVLQKAGRSDLVDQVEAQNLAEREAEQIGLPPQDAQGAAQDPAGAQGAVQPGNEQAQPQNAPQAREEPFQPGPQGAWSNVWSGGEEGKGRRLTAREAEWTRKRIESGASVSDQQLSMFGPQRDERGSIVDSAGNAFNGFGGEEEKKPLPGSPDAKDENRERKRRKV